MDKNRKVGCDVKTNDYRENLKTPFNWPQKKVTRLRGRFFSIANINRDTDNQFGTPCTDLLETPCTYKI